MNSNGIKLFVGLLWLDHFTERREKDVLAAVLGGGCRRGVLPVIEAPGRAEGREGGGCGGGREGREGDGREEEESGGREAEEGGQFNTQ